MEESCKERNALFPADKLPPKELREGKEVPT